MVEQLVQQVGDGSKPIPSLQMHELAKERFNKDRSKAFQCHIRQLYAEYERRPQLPSLAGALVEKVSNEEASQIILKYEWLKTMASGTVACYGLKLNGELLGVACFNVMGQKIREICKGDTDKETEELAKKTVCLARGACVPHAPKNAASFLIRWACRLSKRDFGWEVFFAYSDSAAGEIGTVYQAVGWHYIGTGLGRPKNSFHTDYTSPDGKTVLTSYAINHGRLKLMKRYGTPDGVPFRQWLTRNGWTQTRHYSSAKGKYVWFEGTDKERLKQLCRYPILPFPKRSHRQSSRSDRGFGRDA